MQMIYVFRCLKFFPTQNQVPQTIIGLDCVIYHTSSPFSLDSSALISRNRKKIEFQTIELMIIFSAKKLGKSMI